MQNCQVGLNFANVQEAEKFQNAVQEKICQRDRQGQFHISLYFVLLFLTFSSAFTTKSLTILMVPFKMINHKTFSSHNITSVFLVQLQKRNNGP